MEQPYSRKKFKWLGKSKPDRRHSELFIVESMDENVQVNAAVPKTPKLSGKRMQPLSGIHDKAIDENDGDDSLIALNGGGGATEPLSHASDSPAAASSFASSSPSPRSPSSSSSSSFVSPSDPPVSAGTSKTIRVSRDGVVSGLGRDDRIVAETYSRRYSTGVMSTQQRLGALNSSLQFKKDLEMLTKKTVNDNLDDENVYHVQTVTEEGMGTETQEEDAETQSSKPAPMHRAISEASGVKKPLHLVVAIGENTDGVNNHPEMKTSAQEKEDIAPLEGERRRTNSHEGISSLTSPRSKLGSSKIKVNEAVPDPRTVLHNKRLDERIRKVKRAIAKANEAGASSGGFYPVADSAENAHDTEKHAKEDGELGAVGDFIHPKDYWMDPILLRFEPPQIEVIFQNSEMYSMFQSVRHYKGIMVFLLFWQFVNAAAGIVYDTKDMALRWTIVAVASAMFCVCYFNIWKIVDKYYTMTLCFVLVCAGGTKSLVIDSNGTIGLALYSIFQFFALRGKCVPIVVCNSLDLLLYNAYVFYNWNDLNISTDPTMKLGQLDILFIDILQIFVLILVGSLAHKYEGSLRKKFIFQKLFEYEQVETESILQNIFPPHINKVLQDRADAQSNEVIAFDEPGVTIVFVEVTAMSAWMKVMNNDDLVAALDAVWSMFDEICDFHRIQKMETVGKTYLAASGLPGTAQFHAKACAATAVEMQSVCDSLSIDCKIGVHQGPVIAGVVGVTRPQFSLFGDTVNTSSRVNSTGTAGAVTFSEPVFAAVGNTYDVTERVVEAKGKGKLYTYRVDGQSTEEGKVIVDQYRMGIAERTGKSILPLLTTTNPHDGGASDGGSDDNVLINAEAAESRGMSNIDVANGDAAAEDDGDNLEQDLDLLTQFSTENTEDESLVVNLWTLKLNHLEGNDDENLEMINAIEQDYYNTRRRIIRSPGAVTPFIMTCLFYLFEFLSDQFRAKDPNVFGSYLPIFVIRIVMMCLNVVVFILCMHTKCLTDGVVYSLQLCYYTLVVLISIVCPVLNTDAYTGGFNTHATVSFIFSFMILSNLGCFFFDIFISGTVCIVASGAAQFYNGAPGADVLGNCMYGLGGVVINLFSSYFSELYDKRGVILVARIKDEKRRADTFLHQMLPKTIANSVKRGIREAQQFDNVTILYSDIKGFTLYSASSTPACVVSLLSTLFSQFDALTHLHNVYKVQTIGDAYVIVSGFPFVKKKKDKNIQRLHNKVETFEQRLKDIESGTASNTAVGGAGVFRPKPATVTIVDDDDSDGTNENGKEEENAELASTDAPQSSKNKSIEWDQHEATLIELANLHKNTVTIADPHMAMLNCLRMGVDMLRFMSRVRTEKDEMLNMRLGVHTGSIIGGVVGEKKLRYDIWGHDAIIANKMESTSEPGCILISEDTERLMTEEEKKEFKVEKFHDTVKYYTRPLPIETFLIPVRKDGEMLTDEEAQTALDPMKKELADLQQKVEDLEIEIAGKEKVLNGGGGGRLFSTGSSINEKGSRLIKCGCLLDPEAFCNNAVKNTKYTWWNFLFLSIFNQFRFYMNAYFLLIALLQLDSTLTPVSPLSTWLPLLFIFCVTAIREGVDDYRKKLDDDRANATPFTVGKRCAPLASLASATINVGDLVFLRNNEFIPADIIVLKSSDKEGSCFLSTATLDGETTLKVRQAVRSTQEQSKEDIVAKFNGTIQCPNPNEQLHSFDALLWLEAYDIIPRVEVEAITREARSTSVGGNRDTASTLSTDNAIPITMENVLLQGCKVQNTDWVLGVVVYTGSETKFGMNMIVPPVKTTKIMTFTDWAIVIIFIFQVLSSGFLGVVGEMLSRVSGKQEWYLMLTGSTDGTFGSFTIPLRYLLLASSIIPVSLKVTLDICKVVYQMFIQADLSMIDPISQLGAAVTNTTVIEDIGQVQVVVTDKTGTLTQNIMTFRSCHANKVHYSDVAEMQAALHDKDPALTHLLVQFCLVNEVLVAEKRDFMGAVDDIASPMGATGILEQKEATRMEEEKVTEVDYGRRRASALLYKGSSPDEVALVEGCGQVGVEYVGKDDARRWVKVGGELKEYEIVHMLPFTSLRKRMSVVVRDVQSRQLHVMVKGADEVVIPLLNAGVSHKVAAAVKAQDSIDPLGDLRDVSDDASADVQENENTIAKNNGRDESPAYTQYLRDVERVVHGIHGAAEYASSGYRILFFGSKLIKAEELEAFSTALEAATKSYSDREKKVEEVWLKHLENKLTFDGLSAIEDKLQDQVPEVIDSLRKAKVKVWMCTGDNMTTALKVAAATKISAGRPLDLELVLEGNDPASVGRNIKSILRKVHQHVSQMVAHIKKRASMIQGKVGGDKGQNPYETMNDGGVVPLPDEKQLVRMVTSGDSLRRQSINNPANGVAMQNRKRTPSVSMSTSREGGPRMSVLMHSLNRMSEEEIMDENMKDEEVDQNFGLSVLEQQQVVLGDKESRPVFDMEITVAVRGHTLQTALFSHRQLFNRMCQNINNVVACRVTPAQKALLVESLKSVNLLTLAIGDGGNDVGMIQAAHVGVGVRGVEGMQAARAADVQINSFKDLSTLMFTHGRFSYFRTQQITQFCLYKSVFFCIMQMAYATLTQFSGTSLFSSLEVLCYNAILFIPVLTLLLNTDVPMDLAKNLPQLYARCHLSKHFNLSSLTGWVVRGAIQGLLCVTITVTASSQNHLFSGRPVGDYDTLGMTAFFSYMWIQTLTLFNMLSTVTTAHVVIILGFQLLCYLGFFVVCSSTTFESLASYNSFQHVMASPIAWLTQALVVTCSFVPIMVGNYFMRLYRPNAEDKTRHFDELRRTVSEQKMQRIQQSITELKFVRKNSISQSEDIFNLGVPSPASPSAATLNGYKKRPSVSSFSPASAPEMVEAGAAAEPHTVAPAK